MIKLRKSSIPSCARKPKRSRKLAEWLGVAIRIGGRQYKQTANIEKCKAESDDIHQQQDNNCKSNEKDIFDIDNENRIYPCDNCFDYVKYGYCSGCVYKSRDQRDHTCREDLYCDECNYYIGNLCEMYDSDPHLFPN